jgi:hypothetical protein
MNIYAIDKLMSKTRQLAAEYRRLTGQVLPVSNELSRHDVMTKLNFTIPEQPESGVDLIGVGSWAGKKIQVKSRVAFTKAKSRPRLGHLNFDGKWDFVILVIMNEDYVTEEIYIAKKEVLLNSMKKNISTKNKNHARNNFGISGCHPRESGDPGQTKCTSYFVHIPKDRNTISVAKFKVIGELIWSWQEEDLVSKGKLVSS